MSKKIGIFHCAVAAAALGLAGQCQAHSQSSSTVLTAFSPGPVGRYCGSLAQEGMGCLQDLPEAISAGAVAGTPSVLAEFYVGRKVPDFAFRHASWHYIDEDSGQESGRDVGQWLSHGRHDHHNDSDQHSYDDSGMGSTPICDPTPVPLPSGLWLLASGLFGGIFLRHRRPFATQM